MIGSHALGARRSSSRSGGIVVWATCGALAALVAMQLEEAVRMAAYAASGPLGARHADVRAISWGVTIAVPCACVVAIGQWLRRRAPAPAVFLESRASLVTLATLCASPILLEGVIAVLRGQAWSAIGASAAYLHGNVAFAQATPVVMALSAVALGALAARLRPAAVHALSARERVTLSG